MSWKVVVVLDSGEKLYMRDEIELKDEAENAIDALKHAFRGDGTVSFWDSDGDYVAINGAKVKAFMASERKDI